MIYEIDPKELLTPAMSGDANAQNTLGVYYGMGLFDGKPDFDEAVKWYRKAAEQGHAEAQYNLAVCYRMGRGVPMNDAIAEFWFNKASEQGIKIKHLYESLEEE
ncbi:MAG: sel1 repeat family protein [Ruminococcaceae bacterium]|nr:sel1 repeat family protein [Oscillospiraceae bacterium]